MAVPLTYSAPGEEFDKSLEDSLRYAVWLLHMADNLMVRRYAFDPDDLVAGVRIVQTWKNAHTDHELLSLPQLIIEQEYQSPLLALLTARQGVKTVIITAWHLTAYDTSFAADDIDDDEVTIDQVAQRSERIFMRGTLYLPGTTTNRGKLVDPYHSPLYTADDAPDPSRIGSYVAQENPKLPVLLNSGPPTLTRQYREWARRFISPDEDAFEIRKKQPNLLAVGYGVTARYEVQVSDRETMST